MLNSQRARKGIEKLPTGIPGFDQVADGRLPKGRTTLVLGSAGSAKTVFAVQFLAQGIRNAGVNGVFVTFEEPSEHIREYTIDGRGMHLGKPFRNVSGILSGNFSHSAPEEADRISNLFKEEAQDETEF